MVKIFFKSVILTLLFVGLSFDVWSQCPISSFGTSDCNGNFLVTNPSITSFIFASTTHTTAGCDNVTNGRTFFSTPVFNVIQNQSYNFTINSNANLSFYAAIWIDYNNNSQFEITENVWNSGSTSNTSFTGSITIPGSTATGTLRMRVRTAGETVMTGNDACTSFISVLFAPNPDFGETHDYNVNITGSAPTLDMSATALVTPTSPFCGGNSNVVIQIRNQSTSTINFATNNVTVNASVSGTNPQTFPALVLNSGTLPTNSTQNVTVATGYNMTAPGIYTFNASTSVTGDINTSNDAMPAANVTVNTAPTASLVGSSTICPGNSAQLTFNLTGAGPYSITYTDGVTPVTVSGITSSPYFISVTPSVSTTYTLTAASNTICPASSASGTHVVTLRPSATALLSGTTTICPSGTATLTVQFSGTSPFAYSYTDGTTPITVTGITNNPLLLSVNPVASVTYSGVALNDFCGISLGFSGTPVVTVSTSSSANLSGGGSFCAGSSANLQVNLLGASPWDITYTNGTSLFTISGINISPYTLIVTPTGNTTYSLTGVSNSCGTGIGTGTVGLTQLSPPTVLLSGGETICSGNGAQLTATFTGVNPWVFSYSSGSTPIQLTANSSPYFFAVSPTATQTYTATNVSMPGCNSGNASGSAIIVVGSSSSGVISGSTTICSGQGAILQVNLTGGPPYAFSYSNGSGNVTITGVQTSPYSIQVFPGNTTTYTLVSMNSTGCGLGSVSGSAVVSVANPPIAVLSGGGAICQSGTAQLSVTLSGSAPWNLTYTNGVSPVILTGITNNPYIISITPTTNPSIYNLNQLGDSQCSSGLFTGTATFTVGTPTTATITGPASVCIGSPAILTIAMTGGNHPPFSITYADGTVPNTITGITANPYLLTVTVSAANTYTLLTVSNSICNGALNPLGLAIGVNLPPIANFTATLSNDTLYTINNASNANSYSWNFGSNSNWISGTNPSHIYTSSGSYTVSMVANGPCGSDTSTQIVVVVLPVSSANLAKEDHLTIFPNPSEGKFKIIIPNELKGKHVTLSLLDMSGKVVWEEIRNTDSTLEVSVEQLKGMYILNMLVEGERWIGKLVLN